MNITGGKYNNRRLLVPDESITRPTLSKVRMGIFNTLYSLIDFEGKSFFDVFGGSGVMGLEAISRGFEKVLVFEKNKTAAQIIKTNYENFGLKANLIIGDSLKLLSKTEEKFDVVYIDPPYSSGIYEEVLSKLKSVLKPESIIITESVTEIDYDKNDYELIKIKAYGDKIITFLRALNC